MSWPRTLPTTLHRPTSGSTFAQHPEVKTVKLSSTLLKRLKQVADQWQVLDSEMEDSGIAVYFVAAGTCTWEALFSTGVPTGPDRPVSGQAQAPEGPLPGVTLTPTHSGSPRPEREEVLQPGEFPVVITGLGPQAAMFALPEDEDHEPESSDPDAGFLQRQLAKGRKRSKSSTDVPPAPIPAVTPGPVSNHRPEPVLQRPRAGREDSDGFSVEARIRELAVEGGSTRKIAAALKAEGFNISHMKVARVLRKTPQEVH